MPAPASSPAAPDSAAGGSGAAPATGAAERTGPAGSTPPTDTTPPTETSTLTDAELLARHSTGDPEAFGLLFQRHRDRLWAVALRTLGDPEEAADALQDALVSAFRAAAGFEGRSAVTTWLHRIVVNACLDRARRAATRRAGSLDETPERLDTLLGTAEAPETAVVRAEQQREISAALAALPPDQRAALVLVDMQGYPVAEAAAVLGVPTGTVKSRCARGRARLLPLLGHLRTPAADPAVSRETTAPAPVAVSRETATAPGPATDGNPAGPAPVQPAATERPKPTDGPKPLEGM
ncbi:RNA polymerase sigma factor SigM [Kitasatospora sp. MMS16-BH015]|uniref:RNA polymerase sigma factor SigM n=1 Tax=Kitasatospora sp. MMS16-BH015 TaxID=2018025 RepID=UPI000CA37DC4|nr:RNA polymerase sigma factor SigM [Kitasatospora sp. MMS16-BH015]AUG78549.1 RNA polymerase sigma factor SigM [Kitasatospora sp. MMS16-BH015]